MDHDRGNRQLLTSEINNAAYDLDNRTYLMNGIEVTGA
jgi:hypothetical protein